jgi:hypothetical protein
MPLTARKTLDGPIGFVLQADEVQRDLDAIFNGGLRPTIEEARRKAQRLARRQVLVVARVLCQIAHVTTNADAVCDDVLPEDGGAAARGTRQAQQQFDRRRLARAVRAEKAEDRILGHVQVERL